MAKISDKEPDQVSEITNQFGIINTFESKMRVSFIHNKGISQVKNLINIDTTTSIFLNWNSVKQKFNLKP